MSENAAPIARFFPSPLGGGGEGGKGGGGGGLSPRMQTPHPARTASAPPSPTRGEGKKAAHVGITNADSIEQARHRFFRSGAADRFRNQGCDRERADIGGLDDGFGRLDRVGDHQLLQLGRGDARRGTTG